MKTTKRVLAVALAALMLALAIPFAASAATTYSLTVECNKADYTYTVYKIADFDEATGAYKDFATTAIENAIKQSTESTAAVLTAANAATLTGGTPITFTSSKTSETLTGLAAGMYYIKCTGVSAANKSVSQNNIVPLPNKNMAAGATSFTVDVATNKIVEGDEPTVEKDFKVGSNLTTDDQTFGTGDTITYVLTADIPGSYTNQLTQYIITDTMGTGLDKTVHNVTSVKLDNGTTQTDLTYDVTTAAAEIGTATFGVKLKAAELAKESFYGENNKVVVTYTTQLAADAPIATNIPNSDGLKYTNAGGTKTVPGNTVNAKTYNIVAKKVDAQTGAALEGATFTLTYPDGTTTKTAVSNADGIADFGVLLKAGTYTVQETAAPSGYALNSTVESVTLGDGTTGTVQVEISDTKTKLPNTGREGTMMFTIIGGSLILLAGALFVVVMKKRKASK